LADGGAIRRAIASSACSLAADALYAEPPYNWISDVLAAVERGDVVDRKLIAKLSSTLRAENQEADERFHAALRAGVKPPPRDPRLALLGLAIDLTDAKPGWWRPVRWLAESIPDLTAKLRAFIDPFFANASR
jgi:hypothetical protein